VSGLAARLGRIYGEPGDFFYHYTTREAAFGHILPDRQLRLSPYARMRDPMEAKAPLLGAAYSVDDDPTMKNAMQEVWIDAWSKIVARRNHTKLLSLTVDAAGYTGATEAFGRGWSRARMWEQYAERHQGVCLLFRRDAFHDVALGQLRQRSPQSCAGEVRYTQSGILEEDAYMMVVHRGSNADELAREHLRTHIDAFFFRKLQDRESEHEYRFVEPSGDENYSFVHVGDTLAAAIVGAEFPAWQVPAAIEACRAAGADAFQLEWDTLNTPIPFPLRAS
jgi:hypothetical protein